MPQRNLSKRKHKLLDFTTDEFIQKLCNRGYPLDMSLIMTIHKYLIDEFRKGNNCHNYAFWLSANEHLNAHIKESTVCIPLHKLCAILSPMHLYNINYTHLAVVFHTFDIQQWKNMYRYCYLEWAKHTTELENLWHITPRELSDANDEDTLEYIEQFLNFICSNCNQTTCVKSFFLVNRLYKYLIP